MRTLCLALLLVACSVAFVPSAASADPNKLVGAPLGLFAQTFPAGQPFHISHGWLLLPSGGEALGKFRFSLTVDGVEVRPDFIETIPFDDPVLGTLLFRPYVFNFPDGMTGTHVFAGTFLGPCQGVVDSGFAPGPCASKNGEIPTSASPFTTTVTFVP
jgi:hypothetical protein